MSFEFSCFLIRNYCLDPQFGGHFWLKHHADHFLYSLRRHCRGFNKVELYEEGGLRVFKDIEIAKFVESNPKFVGHILDSLFHLNPECLTEVLLYLFSLSGRI
jgi:hypothetical protein